jgi:hypothetical protein
VCILQVNTMRRVDHPNIVELNNAFLSADGKTLYVDVPSVHPLCVPIAFSRFSSRMFRSTRYAKFLCIGWCGMAWHVWFNVY